MLVPVWTLSPICRSDIFTEFPFSILTFAKLGKQPSDDDDGGGGTVKDTNIIVIFGKRQ